MFEQWPEEPCNKLDLIPLGGVDFKTLATDHQKEVLHTVIQRLKDRVSQRRILVKPCFQDFDKLVVIWLSKALLHGSYVHVDTLIPIAYYSNLHMYIPPEATHFSFLDFFICLRCLPFFLSFFLFIMYDCMYNIIGPHILIIIDITWGM